jgi:tripartite-type tricarboxylate transporter receptor subunit TctC
MPQKRRTLIAAGLALFAAGAFAQPGGYPNKPIRLILPFAPGGPSDVVARLIANKLGEQIKQPVIPVNAPGAGGQVASQQVAAAAPDGYTLFYANQSTLNIAPQVMQRPRTEFVAIAPVLSFSLVLAANANVPAKDFKELVQQLKAKPGSLSFASPGVGTTPHLIGEMFQKEAGVKMVHVAYKGAAPAVQDLLAGHVQLFFDQLFMLEPHFKDGKLKPLATTSPTRLPALPDVPTMTELGLPQLTLQSWSGMVAPAGTPPETVNYLNREFRKVLDLPEIREAITSRGLEPMKGTPDAFARMIREDYPRWTALIKSANIVAE